ncbi:MAG TPA: AmmeMemoRadiSam system radical SAM enzyme [Anaerolineae bacterium]|nr:AmmeMemoRadiSam system radical SAM enzyme [Anaerolineae bacterium]
MQEALYYVGLESGLDCGACHQPDEPDRVLYCHTTHGSRYVRCMLCPRGCVISEGERGECGVRENRGGKLYTMVYGNPCAVHVDPIEKKPFYHFLPGTGAFSIATAGCNLHCFYCQNWSISQSRPEETQNYDLPPESVVWYAQRTHAISVAFTYSEPTVFYEYMLATAQLARQAGLHPVVISAGYINPEPLRQLCHAVDAIKIDLKGYNDTFYHKVCDGALAPVLDAIKIIHEEGMHLEIVNLVVPTLNDAEEDMRALAHWVLDELGPDVPVHFSRFYPQYKLQNLPPTPVETVARAREIAMEAGIHYAYVGNVPGHPGNHTYCHHCGRRIIARSGFAVTEYHLVDGKCEYCGTPIPGVWHPGRGPEPGQRFEGHGPADY